MTKSMATIPAPTCEVCGQPLRTYCPSCRGRQGGASKSPAKVRASRKAAKLALAARMKKRRTG